MEGSPHPERAAQQRSRHSRRRLRRFLMVRGLRPRRRSAVDLLVFFQQFFLGFAEVGIGLDAIRGADELALGLVLGADAFRTAQGIDDIDRIARVLRPGGMLAVTVPAWLPERICWRLSDAYHNTPGGHVRIYTRPELEAKLRAAGFEVGGHHHAHGLHSPYWWLKCAVGVHDDAHPLARAYHRLLVWDIMKHPPVTRLAERALNPLIGKSIVLYAHKPHGAARPAAAPPATVTAQLAQADARG